MNAQPFGWDDLRHLLAVARHGTLSGAARDLAVDHSTVFRRIRSLEERVGTRLFDRMRSGYALTAEGEEMRATAERMEEMVVELDRRLTGRDVALSGNLRVTTVDTLAVQVLPALIRGFREKYPGIELELGISNEVMNLSRREADVAVRPSRDPESDLFGRRVSRVAFAPYASPAYLDGAPPVRTDADLGAHHVVQGDETLAHMASERWLERKARGATITLRGSSPLVLQAAVREGLGVALLPCYLGDTDPELVRVLPPVPEAASEIWVLCHPDLRRTARVRAFLEYLGN